MYVFVYGTLKRNEPNYHWMISPENGKGIFVAKGKTMKKYPLVIASRYNIPFLLDEAGTGNNIEGEIFEIDEKMLHSLDILEEVPHLYTRRVEDIVVGSNVVQAWCYFLHSFYPDMMRCKHLVSYSSADRTHNMPYIAKYYRDQNYDHRVEVKYMM